VLGKIEFAFVDIFKYNIDRAKKSIVNCAFFCVELD
jgi:hypothetical protein